MPHRRVATVELIRARRSMGLATRRRRLPPQRQPDSVRLAYYQGIRQILGEAKAAVMREIAPHLEAWAPPEPQRTDEVSRPNQKARRAIDRAVRAWEARRALHERAMADLAERIGDRTSDWQRGELSKQLRARLGVDLPTNDAGLQTKLADFTARNVALIKSVPAEYFADIERVVLEGVREGRRHEQIAKDLTERHSVAESHARLIARDQVGKFHGELNRARQQAAGITRYIWRTSRDNRVREEHEERDGEAFEWSSPPEDGHPGHAINCRCNADPDVEGLIESLEGGGGPQTIEPL